MTRALLLVLAVMACAKSAQTPAQPPQPPGDAGVVDTRAREACMERCERFVMTRHDACGPGAGPPWPDWCRDSNDRMRFDCESDCP